VEPRLLPDDPMNPNPSQKAVVLSLVLVASLSALGKNPEQNNRVVRDLSALNLLQVAQETNALWVVAKVTPSETSLTKMGKLGPVVEGTCEVVSFLGLPSGARAWSYAWDFGFHSRNPEDQAIFSPFRHPQSGGGLIICRINGSTEGASRFSPVYLLPAGGERLVQIAVKFHRENSALFDPAQAIKRKAELLALTEHENSLVAISACRMLANAECLNAQFVSGPLASAESLTQAAFTYLLLRTIPDAHRADVLQSLASLIVNTNDPKSVEGIKLGASSALNDRESTQARELGRTLLEMVNEKKLK